MQREIQTGPKPERNPETYRNHRREVLWQITIPLLVGAVIIIVLMILVTFGSAFQLSKWADISVIWLTIPMYVVLLVLLVLVAGLTYGIIWVIANLPPVLFMVLKYLRQANAIVRKASDTAVKPFIRIQELGAGWRAFWGR